ncbi:MAG: hypothetical protein AAGI38_10825 [Bacteroidota bacterium]
MNREDQLALLHPLRDAGFFKEYRHLSDGTLLEHIHTERKNQLGRVANYDYVIRDRDLVLADTAKMFWVDPESDPLETDQFFVYLVSRIDKIRGRNPIFSKVRETWNEAGDKVKVTCNAYGENLSFSTWVGGSWFGTRIIDNIQRLIREREGIIFCKCYGPDKEWMGQYHYYIRLTPAEKQLLQQQLNWTFGDWDPQIPTLF